MKRLLPYCVLLVGLFLFGCGENGQTSPSAQSDTLQSPAALGSGQPRLYTSSDGTVWMSWLEPSGDDVHALRYATLADTGWTEPKTVAVGGDWFVNWADLPAVRPLPDGRIVAHYLESNGPSALAYAVRIMQTTREGGPWQEPITPHTDRSATEHGFVSLLPWTNDRVLATWLDGRKMDTEGGGPGGGEMTLRSAEIDSTGEVQRRAVVDERTCECCATSTVRVGGEALLAYRNRSAGEIRDIQVARYDGEAWSEPTLLHADGWDIEGCPVNGPALASENGRVVATWFTAAGGVPRVRGAFSTDGGRHFGEPIVVAEGSNRGRVDVVLLENGAAVVSWLGTGNDGTVRARLVRPDGTLADPVTVADLSSADRSAGFPKMVHRQDTLYFAWVAESRSSGRSRVQNARVGVHTLQ